MRERAPSLTGLSVLVHCGRLSLTTDTLASAQGGSASPRGRGSLPVGGQGLRGGRVLSCGYGLHRAGPGPSRRRTPRRGRGRAARLGEDAGSRTPPSADFATAYGLRSTALGIRWEDARRLGWCSDRLRSRIKEASPL